jgi:DNA repair exonuclease SbcCD ATPase subunit
VAVSLALALCRFANGERRPLESIIIDEGFGSLDREGRMAMIAELRDPQPLGQLFKRVLVVSHQEDFASAFPVGYSLRSEGGVTVAELFRQG